MPPRSAVPCVRTSCWFNSKNILLPRTEFSEQFAGSIKSVIVFGIFWQLLLDPSYDIVHQTFFLCAPPNTHCQAPSLACAYNAEPAWHSLQVQVYKPLSPVALSSPYRKFTHMKFGLFSCLRAFVGERLTIGLRLGVGRVIYVFLEQAVSFLYIWMTLNCLSRWYEIFYIMSEYCEKQLDRVQAGRIGWVN